QNKQLSRFRRRRRRAVRGCDRSSDAQARTISAAVSTTTNDKLEGITIRQCDDAAETRGGSRRERLTEQLGSIANNVEVSVTLRERRIDGRNCSLEKIIAGLTGGHTKAYHTKILRSPVISRVEPHSVRGHCSKSATDRYGRSRSVLVHGRRITSRELPRRDRLTAVRGRHPGNSQRRERSPHC